MKTHALGLNIRPLGVSYDWSLRCFPWVYALDIQSLVGHAVLKAVGPLQELGCSWQK